MGKPARMVAGYHTYIRKEINMIVNNDYYVDYVRDPYSALEIAIARCMREGQAEIYCLPGSGFYIMPNSWHNQMLCCSDLFVFIHRFELWEDNAYRVVPSSLVVKLAECGGDIAKYISSIKYETLDKMSSVVDLPG